VSKASDLLRVEFILEMIEDIEFIVEHDKSIILALEDRIHKPALLMSLMQIGETLNKIESNIIKSKLPIKGAYDVRNFIAHDYEGVDLALIEHIIRNMIPELKETIQEILT
jgi:uncharacterized protein with HEPN domain